MNEIHIFFEILTECLEIAQKTDVLLTSREYSKVQSRNMYSDFAIINVPLGQQAQNSVGFTKNFSLIDPFG